MSDDQPFAEKKARKPKKKKSRDKSRRISEIAGSDGVPLSDRMDGAPPPRRIEDVSERPGDPSRQLDLGATDYVLFYETPSRATAADKEKQKWRDRFEDLLRRDGVFVEKVPGDGYCYVTLRCAFQRLACEAERILLEMPLKDLKLDPGQQPCTAALDNCFRTDFEDDYVSVPFEQSKADKFRDWGDEKKFFRPALRGLLVHSILTNMCLDNVVSDSKGSDERDGGPLTKKGLPYLLLKKVYSDAFILHDMSEELTTTASALQRPRVEERKGAGDEHSKRGGKQSSAKEAQSARTELGRLWPSPFKYQPMWMIRNYFGEEIALYFAWIGVLTWSVTIPALFGLAIFFYGVYLSVSNKSSSTAMVNSTTITPTFNASMYTTYAPVTSSPHTNSSATTSGTGTTSVIGLVVAYGEDLLSTIQDALDNDITPWYSIIICVWGTIFLELWKRRNAVLAFQWDVDQYESNEVDRPEYQGSPKEDRVTKEPLLYYSSYRRAAKIATSFSFLIVMVCVVIMVTVAVVVYRVLINVDYCLSYKWSSLTCTIMTNLIATVANAIVILILSMLYEKLAYVLTDWENHRTSTDYKDALIVKLFAFLFTNNFTSLYYIAFFRGNYAVTGSGGILGLGANYIDSCAQDSTDKSCMPMLSLQILILIIIKPLISTARELLTPVISRLISRIRRAASVSPKHSSLPQDKEAGKNLTDLAYLDKERLRPPLGDFTLSQYADKVIQYGYLMIFAVSMPLAPIIVILVNIVDRVIDSRRMLWKYRRPVAHRAQDIGTWYYTLDFLNICGVITNACLIAFTSKWGTKNLVTGCEKLAFILGYEHGVFALKYIIALVVPDVPRQVKKAMRREKYLIAQAMNTGRFAQRQSEKPSTSVLYPDLDASRGKASGQTLPPVRRPTKSSFDKGYGPTTQATIDQGLVISSHSVDGPAKENVSITYDSDGVTYINDDWYGRS